MNVKKLVVLAVIAVLLSGLAYMSSKKSRQRRTAPSSMMGKPVLESIQATEALNSIEEIVFTTANSTTVAARVDGTWVAPDKFNYPVNFTRIRDFLRKLRELKIGQMVSGDERQLKELQLLPPENGTADSAGTLIDLRDGSGNTVASMLVGKEHMRSAPADGPAPYGMRGGYPNGRYVSSAGRACLVSDTLGDMPGSVRDWMETSIGSVTASDPQELTISHGDKSVTLRRSEEGALEFPDLSRKEEMDAGKVNGIATILSYLSFDDVADPSLSDEALGFDKPVTCSSRNGKNQVFALLAGGSPEGSDNRYVRLTASYSPSEEESVDEPEPRDGEAAGEDAASGPEADEAAASKAEEEARKKKEEQERLAAEVEEFNTKVKDWTYIVASHKLRDLSVDRSDFVKEKEEEQENEK